MWLRMALNLCLHLGSARITDVCRRAPLVYLKCSCSPSHQVLGLESRPSSCWASAVQELYPQILPVLSHRIFKTFKKCIAVLWSKIGSLPVWCGLMHSVGEAKLLLSWVGPGWQWLYPLLLSLPRHSGKGRYPLLSDLNSSDLAEPPRESQGSLGFCEPSGHMELWLVLLVSNLWLYPPGSGCWDLNLFLVHSFSS